MKADVSSTLAILVIILMVIPLSAALFTFASNQVSVFSEETLNTQKKFQAARNIEFGIESVSIDGGEMTIVVRNRGVQNVSSFIVKVISSGNAIHVNSSVYLGNMEKLGPSNAVDVITIFAPFGDSPGNYSIIEVYPRFEFSGSAGTTEEIAMGAWDWAGGAGFIGGSDENGTEPAPPVDDFIFTFFPTYIHLQDKDVWTKQTIDKAMEAGMTHAAVLFSDTSNQTNVQYYLAYMRNKGYKVAIGFVSSWPLSFFNQNSGSKDKLLNASCLNITKCTYWNGTYSINPALSAILKLNSASAKQGTIG